MQDAGGIVGEQGGAGGDGQGARADRSLVGCEAIGTSPDHESAGIQIEARGEGAFRTGEGQDARAGLAERVRHAGMLADRGGDIEADHARAGVDRDDGAGGGEFERGQGVRAGPDGRNRRQGLVGRRDGVGGIQDEATDEAGTGRRTEVEFRIRRSAVVDEGEAGERMLDIGSRARRIVAEGQASASVDDDAGAGADLPRLRVRHGDGSVADRQDAADRQGSPGVAGPDGLIGQRRVVGAGRVDDQGRIGVDRRDLGAGREVGVRDDHADREAGRVRHGDGVRRRRDGGGDDDGLGTGIEAQGARIHESASRVIVVGELRGQLEGAGAERHDRRGAGDPGLDRRRVLESVEIQVAIAAGATGRTRDGVRGVRSDQVVSRVSAGEETGAEGQARPGLESDIMSGADEAPGIGLLAAGDRPRRGVVVVVTGSVGHIGDRPRGEGRHLRHAGGVGIDREGMRVSGRHGPAADDAVDHVGRGETGAVELRKEDLTGTGQAGLAQGVRGGDAKRTPSGEEHRGLERGRAHEVADVDADRRGGTEGGLGVEHVGATEQGDRIERDKGADRACAVDAERAAAEGDRDGLSEARRQGVCERIEAEVIPGQRAVVDLQA